MKLRTRGMTADWQVFPTSAWNYALAPQNNAPHGVVAEEHPVDGVPSWRAIDGVAEPGKPGRTNEAEETITLVPCGAAKLRITAFPA